MNFSVGGQRLGDLLTLEFLVSLLGDVLAAIAILVVGYAIAGWVRRRIRAIGGRKPQLDTTLFNFLGNIARYTVLAFTFLFVLNTFGVQTTSIVAAVGAAGLAVGLALQGTLANVAAGVMIIFFRPVKEGDFVEVAGQMGTVKEITLNFTELASIGNVQIIIPNSEVWGNTIVNYSSYDRRQAEWTFGVGYGADLARAEQAIRQAITGDARTDLGEDVFIQVTTLGPSSVDFLVRAWVSAEDYFAYRADMTRKVKEALDAEGIEIPFPTRTLQMTRTEDAAPRNGARQDTTENEVRAEDEGLAAG